MLRRHFLGFVLLLGLLFIALQIYLANILLRTTKTEVNVGLISKVNDVPTDIHLDNASILKTLSEAISILESVDLVLIDPIVLEAIVTPKKQRNGTCVFLCTNHVTSFGIYAKNLPSYWEKSLAESLRVARFDVKELNSDVSPPITLQGISHGHELLSHIFIHRDDHTISVTVLYDRANFLWHAYPSKASLSLLPWKLTLGSIPFIQHLSSYTRFETVKVKLDEINVLAPRYPDAFLKQMKVSRFIECNTTRASEFYRRYPEDTSLEAKRFQETALEVIRRAKKILDDLGVPFWLSSGTCLGWFRQCNVITYSMDVDLGIWIKDYNPKIMPKFKLHGFQLDHIFGKVSDSFQLAFKYRKTKVDLFFFYEKGNMVWNGGTQYDTGKKFMYVFPKFNLCWTELNNIRVSIPCETESYIEANYGKKWFEPVKTWDWKDSPSNVVENGEWPEETWDEVIQMF